MRTILLIISLLVMASQPALAGKKAPSKEEKRQAYEAQMLEKSYLDIEELAENDKTAASYLVYLKKKGIANSAHFEQYKVRIRVEGLQKYRPRRWSETGHSDQRVPDPYEVSKKAEPPQMEAKERW